MAGCGGIARAGGRADDLRWTAPFRISTLEDELRDARARADATERQMADAQTAATEARVAVTGLTAPDVARIDLAGQAIAPQASARAFWSRSRGMVFTASNLPPLPAGGRINCGW